MIVVKEYKETHLCTSHFTRKFEFSSAIKSYELLNNIFNIFTEKTKG